MLEDEHSQYWQTVVHTMLDGLMVVAPDGTILFINAAMEQLTGFSRDELIGRFCDMLNCNTCFDTRAKGGDKHCKLFKDGEIRLNKCVLQRKDGSLVHVLKNAAVLKDRDGEVVGGVETLADCSELVAKDQVITSLRRELSIEDSFQGIIGNSPAMHRVFDLIQSAAQSDASVVICGESGTGKELVAGAIHKLGPRCNGPFITVNCAALNESLLESELFGHVKGAFTGAESTRVGRFEAADGGDIFLDEIGDLPQSTQVKLLRFLQERVIEKVGEHRPIPINVRFLAASNKDLDELMAEGLFREDFYYRIAVIPIHLPPLRERREDISLLIDTFINRLRLKTDKAVTGITKKALEFLIGYHWPGNVRELINAIEYAFVLCSGGEITPDHLPLTLIAKPQPLSSERPRARGHSISDDERERLLYALKKAGGNKSEAARIMGISRVTLWKRLKLYDIQVDKKIQG